MGMEVAAAAMAVGKIYEITEQRKAADAADRAATNQLEFQQRKYAEEKRMSDVANIRNMRQSIRQARLASASMLNTAANKGGMGGSGLAGGQSAIAAQSAGNVNFMMQQAQSNAMINSDMLSTAGRVGEISAYGRQASANAALGGMVADVGSSIFGAAGGPAAFTSGINSIFESSNASGAGVKQRSN